MSKACMMKKILLYSVVFLGCFFEGETSLTTSAFASHRGYLEIVAVMFIALAATQSWDWIWFTVGRKRGKRFVENKPKLRQKIKKIDTLLNKSPTPVLLGYRFLFGFRTAVPLVIGMSSISKKKFLTFSLINTILWDIAFSSLGFFFGAFLKANWKRIEDYEIEIMACILVAGVMIGLFLRHKSLKKVAKISQAIASYN
ncbi:MAG: DedA family protein [Bacteroidota bacterium]|nr:DedA family protein [Bacteroidota bacterium]